MTDLQVARGLGWFSIGLGLTEVAAPRWLGKTADVGKKPKLLRAFGAREIGAGIAVLSQRKPGSALWGRVAGDALDLAFLGSAFRRSSRRNRVAIAIAAVLGVTALDVLYARKLSA